MQAKLEQAVEDNGEQADVGNVVSGHGNNRASD